MLPLQTSMWDHRPICGSFPEPQTDLCLRRGDALGGEGQADSGERSEQGQHRDTDSKPLNLCHKHWPHLSPASEGSKQKKHLEEKRTGVCWRKVKRGRQSTEEDDSRQLERRPKKSGLIFSKYSCVIKIKFSYSHSWLPLRILKALKQIKMAWEFVKVTVD